MGANDTIGYGQMGPDDVATHEGERDFTIRQSLAKVRTAQLVKVLAVDTDKMTVDVQVAVNMLDGNNQSTQHGRIHGIPYPRMQNGTNAFVMEPAVGDIGLMAVCDRDISAVKSTKAVANPGSARKHNLSDGVYLGGYFSQADPEQFIKFTSDGISIQAKGGHTLTSTENDGWVIDKLKVTGALQADSVASTNDVTAGTVSLKNHRHSGVQTGGGQSGPPVP